MDFRSRTFWVGGIGGLVAAAGGYFTGEMNLFQAVGAATLAIAVIFGRRSITNAVNEIKNGAK